MPRFLSYLLAALLACFTTAHAVETPPNFVILLADDLGINDLGCFGRKDQRTPNLDQLAAQGARFTQGYAAASVCSASRAALLTGQNPARLKITSFLLGRGDRASHRLLSAPQRDHLPEGVQTIAQLLKAKGYATGAVGKWHLGMKGAHPPTDHGFDEYFPGKSFPGAEAPQGGKGELGQADAAVQFIERSKAKPFLLYVAFDNPHIPLAAPAKGIAANAQSFHPTYAALVESLDSAVGRILKALDDQGLAQNTLVVFASDNGGLHVSELRETPPTHNEPCRAGKGFVYEGGIRTPLIMRWPGRLAAREIAEPVVLGDLCPTICALAKVSPPAIQDFKDLSPLLFDGKPIGPTPRALYWHQPHYMNQGGKPAGVVREGDWKLIEQYEDGSLELYNLAKDPSEKTDVAAAEPARVAALRGKLEAWRRSVGAEPTKANPNFDRARWENCFVKFDASRVQALPTSAAMRPLMAAWREAMNDATPAGPNALIFLEARDAKVQAKKLKYEDPPQKDTLGFWVDPTDTASWTFPVAKPGKYRISILQGCGKGSGGSTVALEVGTAKAEFTVAETGHFQRFIAREVGLVDLTAGENTLTVRPLKKKGAAVMDLRRVTLERVE
jgi:arylsulfatase A-like enzyme